MHESRETTAAGAGEAALAAFRNYFSAFMRGSDEEIAKLVALPFFDLREGELLEMRSEPQLLGFRRGLRARMASLGYAFGELAEARVIMAEPSLSLIQFENTRHAPDGAMSGRVSGLAYLRRDELSWRVWMITVLRVHSTHA